MSLIPRGSEILNPDPKDAGSHKGISFTSLLASLPGTDQRGAGARVLLINSGHLGDAIISLAAMRRVRQTMPRAIIAVVVLSPADRILNAGGWFDQVWTLPDMNAAWHRPSAYAAWLRTSARIISFRPQLGISFMPDAEDQTLLAMSCAQIRVGTTKAHNWIYNRGWTTHTMLWQQIPTTSEGYHRVSDLAGMRRLNRLSLADFQGNDADRQYVAGLTGSADTAGSGGEDERPLVVLLLCGSKLSKSWPVELYISLAERLEREGRARVVAVTGPGERGLVPRLQREIVDAGHGILFNDQPLTALIVLLQAATLAVTVDSGPGHIAAAAATSTVFITHKKNTVPPGEHVTPVFGPRILEIPLNDVYQAVLDVLSVRTRGPNPSLARG